MNSYFKTDIDKLDKKRLAKLVGYSLKDPSISEREMYLFYKYYKYTQSETIQYSAHKDAAFFALCVYCFLGIENDAGSTSMTDFITILKRDADSVSKTQGNAIESIFNEKVIFTRELIKILGRQLLKMKEPQKVGCLNIQNVATEIEQFNTSKYRKELKIKWIKNIYKVKEITNEEEQ